MASWSYQPPVDLSDEQYQQWRTLLEERTGICFMQHKSILQAGLSQRMREIGVKDYDDYFKQVSAVPGGAIEWSQLVDRISVKETSFFREPNSFAAVKNFLLARLDVEQADSGSDTLELWSVGCSTGEEAYSLAMVATDIADYLASKIYLGVTATDISSTALAFARKGIYNQRKLAGLPPETTHKYFKAVGEDQYQIVPSLREKLCFVQGNIMELENAPAIKMDLIYCQNVFVYFQRWRHQQVLDMFVERLKPGGMLMMGPGEVNHWHNPKMQRWHDDSVQAYVRSA